MKNRAKLILGTLLIALVILACDTQREASWDLGIEGGQLLDLESGEYLTANVYIKDGLIDTISLVQLSADERILAEGKFILPGFWDNHVHFRGGDSLVKENKNYLKWFLINGVTSVRDAGGDLGKEVINWRDSIGAGLLDGPTIYTAGPKLDGANATWAGSLVVDSSESVDMALDSLRQLDVDFVKLYDSRISREAYLWSLEEAESRGWISSGHMPFTVNLDEAVGSGIDAIEHLYYVLKGCSTQEAMITEQVQLGELGFWGSMDQLIATYSEDQLNATSQLLIENNTYVVPTLHIGKTLSYLDEDDHSSDPWLKLVSPQMQATYQGRIDRSLNSSEQAREERKQLDSVFGVLANKLQQQGVGLLSGSDSGAYNSYVYPGVSLHEELREMVDVGMTPLDALRTSAHNGARFIRVDQKVGKLESGMTADLVILNANPLEDIHNSRKLDKVIKAGKVHDPVILAAEVGCSDCLQ